MTSDLKSIDQTLELRRKVSDLMADYFNEGDSDQLIERLTSAIALHSEQLSLCVSALGGIAAGAKPGEFDIKTNSAEITARISNFVMGEISRLQAIQMESEQVDAT